MNAHPPLVGPSWPDSSLSHPAVPPAPPILRVRLIGQMEVRDADGNNLVPAGRKTRALFAMIALTQPRFVTRSRAAETLWSRRPADQARASLRQELHRLLFGLGPIGASALDIGRDQLQARADACWVDVFEIQRATLDDPSPLDRLDGVLLDGLTGIDPMLDIWIGAERERLSDWARSLADRSLQAQKEPARRIEAANRLLTIDRAHEGAWRGLMRAYAASGDPAMALKAFERCRASLSERLGRTPAAETEQLAADIRGNLAATSAGDQLRPEAGVKPGAQSGAQSGTQFGAHPGARSGVAPGHGASSPALAARPFPRPRNDTLRVGIVQLDALDGGERDRRIALGIGHALGAALARFSWFAVVSLIHLTATRSPDRAFGDEFGIDLLIDGTLSHPGDESLRVELRLLDTRAGGTLAWTRRFERSNDDPLVAQDDIAAVAAAQIDAEIMSLEIRRVAVAAFRDRADEPTAYELTIRSFALSQALQRESFVASGALLNRAVAEDPFDASAWNSLAAHHMLLHTQGWSTAPDRTIADAIGASERAITLAPGDARCVSMAGHIAGYLQRRTDVALTLHRRALDTNPCLPMAWAFSAFGQLFAGELDTADRHLIRYKQLVPMLAIAHRYDSAFVYAALLKRDFVGAVRHARDIIAINPAYVLPLRPYLSALGHLGELAEAATVRARLRQTLPGFTVRSFCDASPFQRPVDNAIIAEGLRKAGLEE